MLFTSPLFLFLFLPVALGLHALLPVRLRNGWLLLASLLFYAWGEPRFLPVLLAAIAVNHGLGLAIARARGTRAARPVLAAAVACNLGLLAVMKYGAFAVGNLNRVLAWGGAPGFALPALALPLGISFFTFHAISYAVDVHRGDAPPARNPLHLALYFLLFPHLIAGPIVRWRDLARQIAERPRPGPAFAAGVRRFIVGLGKKVLIANTLALPVDALFAQPPGRLTRGAAWLAVAGYTLQIYCDFSGYSDMAVGLARMLGFTFPENFAHPYAAASVRAFWRRWHVSLSSWFRDYLFIPLGGSRASGPRVYLNLLLVFALCGLWHGARWTFVVWGLFHGAFQILERVGLDAVLARVPRPLRHLYTLAVVMVGWVLFRADGLHHARALLVALVDPRRAGVVTAGEHLTGAVAAALVAGTLAALPLAGWWRETPARLDGGLAVAKALGLALVFVGAAAALSARTYDPFIYFRF